MRIVTLCHMEDSFASLNSPAVNFSKFAYLKVGGKNKKEIDQELNKALIKFDLNKLNSSKNISKVELELYVKDISSESEKISLGIYNNSENFWQSDLCWENSPRIEKEILEFNVTKENENSYVAIDITPLAMEWMKGTVENNGITITTKKEKDEVIFTSSRGYNAPILKVHYKSEDGKKDKEYVVEELLRDYSHTKKSESSYMLITSKDSAVLESGQTITFGNVKLTKGMKYSPSGEIIIKDPGQYVVNFWMNCTNQSEEDMNNLSVNLVKCINGRTITEVLKTQSSDNVVSGKSAVLAATGTLKVSDSNDTFKFVNTSKSNIKLVSNDNNYAASIMITKIEE